MKKGITAVEIRTEVHRRLKIYSATTALQMRDIVTAAVTAYLDQMQAADPLQPNPFS